MGRAMLIEGERESALKLSTRSEDELASACSAIRRLASTDPLGPGTPSSPSIWPIPVQAGSDVSCISPSGPPLSTEDMRPRDPLGLGETAIRPRREGGACPTGSSVGRLDRCITLEGHHPGGRGWRRRRGGRPGDVSAGAGEKPGGGGTRGGPQDWNRPPSALGSAAGPNAKASHALAQSHDGATFHHTQHSPRSQTLISDGGGCGREVRAPSRARQDPSLRGDGRQTDRLDRAVARSPSGSNFEIETERWELAQTAGRDVGAYADQVD